MPIEQRGSNTNAHIHGNFNDVRRDQLNLVVNGNVTFNSERAQWQRSSENTLEGTIRVIQEISRLVPIDVARNILADVTTILRLWQMHVKNRDSLNALAQTCAAICSVLVLATKGASSDRMSEVHRNALGTLQSSMSDLHSRVTNALQRGHTRRSHAASHHATEISAWGDELNNMFTSFSSRLNIVSAIPLEQICDLLQQRGVPNLIPDPPPPRPPMFFGREALLRKVTDALLRDEDVTLIGPGGIGKSTLAMAVMNEKDIVMHYSRRFFVTYEAMDPKTIVFASFVDRIASVLGIPMSGAEGERQIKANLGSSPVLLVLDNAETFEDAVNRDEAVKISDFIAHIANTRGVTVILTSRTSCNARRVSWTQFDVPALDKEPARQSFRKIYHDQIDDNDIDGLLAAVGFHPLSISILAYTARENRWSAKVLLDRWNSQRSNLLQTGDGKDNLGFTIRLSLESRSVKALGNDAVRVLWVVAFFPQGINQDHLISLFPSLRRRISSVTDTLCKVSLMHLSGQFLTTLAPIRLFLLDVFPNAGLELLAEVRRSYYSSLQAVTDKKDSYADLIASDHLNIEHLIAFDIAHAPFDIGTISSTCREFLRGLKWHKPRPTLLSPVISSLPEGSATEKESKAWCLTYLGELYFELSNFSSAGKTYLSASTLFIAIGNHSEAALRASDAALSYNTRGYFSLAKQIVEHVIHSPSWQHLGEESQGKVEIYFRLDWSMMHTTSRSVDQLFLRSMDSNWRGLQSRVYHWQARMYHGRSTPAEVQSHLEPLQSNCMSSRLWNRWEFLSTAAEAAFLQRKFDVAMQLLNQAHKFANGHFRITMLILTFGAAVASAQGDYELARMLAQRCIDTFGVVASSSSNEFLRVLYVQGRNELYAGDYSAACRLLTDVIADCDAQDDIYTEALCVRALGEAEILLNHRSDSNMRFAQAVELCRVSGAPPVLLGVCTPMLKLDDERFPGWRRFLQAHPG